MIEEKKRLTISDFNSEDVYDVAKNKSIAEMTDAELLEIAIRPPVYGSAYNMFYLLVREELVKRML